MSYDLQVRETHNYVGSYQHLDEWRTIGTYTKVATSEPVVDLDDLCEGTTRVHFVEVECEPRVPEKDIKQALDACFTNWGCAHEYDCCGCWSTLGTAEHIGGKTWKVTTRSSRNY